MRRFGVGNSTLTEWLRGLDPPGWTQRPNAKDDLREMAIEMRRRVGGDRVVVRRDRPAGGGCPPPGPEGAQAVHR
jgi:hypothetical protein